MAKQRFLSEIKTLFFSLISNTSSVWCRASCGGRVKSNLRTDPVQGDEFFLQGLQFAECPGRGNQGRCQGVGIAPIIAPPVTLPHCPKAHGDSNSCGLPDWVQGNDDDKLLAERRAKRRAEKSAAAALPPQQSDDAASTSATCASGDASDGTGAGAAHGPGEEFPSAGASESGDSVGTEELYAAAAIAGGSAGGSVGGSGGGNGSSGEASPESASPLVEGASAAPKAPNTARPAAAPLAADLAAAPAARGAAVRAEDDDGGEELPLDKVERHTGHSFGHLYLWLSTQRQTSSPRQLSQRL